MYQFNATVHVAGVAEASQVVQASSNVVLRGEEVSTLHVSTEELYSPFHCTFEQTAAALEEHERAHFEPDGSFVWGEGVGAQRWQIDGHLFDRGGHLLYMHLKGNCPVEVFDHLLRSIGWPRQAVLFQLQQEGYVLNEENFRRFAASKMNQREVE